jgi:HD-GYP domain-containing protein (c-di-GMP phosphodiesterase class II)
MGARRINLSDLDLGQPLPWDVYAARAYGAPLLRKGQIVSEMSDTQQLERLLADERFAGGLRAGEETPPSVLQLLNLANKRLERLLLDLRNENNAERELRDIARDVIHAVEVNHDIALACIFLNQIAGSYAVRHCIETAVVVVLVALGMQKSHEETQTIVAAALTMNVGMLRHHERFQNQRAPLSREEMEIVRRHPEESADLLKYAGVDDEEWLNCVMLHHENDDGSGYPGGKTSADITQNARLIGLADRYCAQVSARNYRRSLLPDQALAGLFSDKPTTVDPVLSEEFIRQLGKYPPGSLVRLCSGEIGVVVQRDGSDGCIDVHALRDAAGAVVPADGLPFAARRSGTAIAEVLHEDEADVRFSMKSIWGDQARL